MNQKTFYQELIERYVAATATKQELDLIFHLMDDEEFFQVLSEAMDSHLLQNLQKVKAAKIVSLRRRRYRLVGIAASFLLMVSISSFYFFSHKDEANVSEKGMLAEEHVIQPGEDQAILTLADGRKIILKEQNNGLLTKEAGLSVYKSKDGILIYKVQASSTPTQTIAYHTISTPRGGQYQIVLEDGSKIWLNAASTVKFPTLFGLQERKIEVSGEVYCEISKDPKRPFRVGFGSQVVEVLGTHFNINAYAEEEETRTTLLEGSIRLVNTQNMQGKLLLPGEQAKMNKADNQLKIKQVNTAAEVAWKDGYFVFNDESLASIMRRVSRWYDVDVVYENGIPQKNFGGKLSKFDDIQKLLDVLTETGSVKFETNGRRITVMN